MSQINPISIYFNTLRLIHSTRSTTGAFYLNRRPVNLVSSYLSNLVHQTSGGDKGHSKLANNLSSSSPSSSSSVLSVLENWTLSPGADREIDNQSSELCKEPAMANEAGPSSQINPKLLLVELQSIRKKVNSSSQAIHHDRVKFLWETWNNFLNTSKGKNLNQNIIHEIDHEFVFLYPSKLSEILDDYLEIQQNPSPSQGLTRFDASLFRSIGFAILKHQNWPLLRKLLAHRINLNQQDVLTIVKSASRKILFSSTLKTQAARIENIIQLMEVITDTFNQETECGKCTSQLIEILCDTLLRMSSHQSATGMVIQFLRDHPNFSNLFNPDFLHRLMRTCASHQHLPLAHELLSELPSQVQTLNQFKACLLAWHRRTSRPLLHSTCSVWDALASHPHLTPDHESYNLYLLVRSKLGHVEDVMKIINSMERREILLNQEEKQKTYGILLHSVGRRKGLQTAYKILPELISKGYKPDEYTSNILLSSRKPIQDLQANSEDFGKKIKTNQEEKERKLIEITEMIEKANMKSDEVTRNIIIQSFLSRAPYHSKDEILNLKSVALDQSKLESGSGLDRNQFRRFRRPLYSMLCEALRRSDCHDELIKLQHEWKTESYKARLNSHSLNSKSS